MLAVPDSGTRCITCRPDCPARPPRFSCPVRYAMASPPFVPGAPFEFTEKAFDVPSKPPPCLAAAGGILGQADGGIRRKRQRERQSQSSEACRQAGRIEAANRATPTRCSCRNEPVALGLNSIWKGTMGPNSLMQSPFAVLAFIVAPAILTNATSVLAMSTITGCSGRASGCRSCSRSRKARANSAARDSWSRPTGSSGRPCCCSRDARDLRRAGAAPQLRHAVSWGLFGPLNAPRHARDCRHRLLLFFAGVVCGRRAAGANPFGHAPSIEHPRGSGIDSHAAAEATGRYAAPLKARLHWPGLMPLRASANGTISTAPAAFVTNPCPCSAATVSSANRASRRLSGARFRRSIREGPTFLATAPLVRPVTSDRVGAWSDEAPPSSTFSPETLPSARAPDGASKGERVFARRPREPANLSPCGRTAIPFRRKSADEPCRRPGESFRF